MTNSEGYQLAEDAASELVATINACNPMPLHDLVREAVMRGMLIGSHQVQAAAETHLAMMKMEKS